MSAFNAVVSFLPLGSGAPSDKDDAQGFHASPLARAMQGPGDGKKANVFESEMAPQDPDQKGALRHARPLEAEAVKSLPDSVAPERVSNDCPEELVGEARSDDWGIPPTQPSPEVHDPLTSPAVVPKRLESVFDQEAR